MSRYSVVNLVPLVVKQRGDAVEFSESPYYVMCYFTKIPLVKVVVDSLEPSLAAW